MRLSSSDWSDERADIEKAPPTRHWKHRGETVPTVGGSLSPAPNLYLFVRSAFIKFISNDSIHIFPTINRGEGNGGGGGPFLVPFLPFRDSLAIRVFISSAFEAPIIVMLSGAHSG